MMDKASKIRAGIVQSGCCLKDKEVYCVDSGFYKQILAASKPRLSRFCPRDGPPAFSVRIGTIDNRGFRLSPLKDFMGDSEDEQRYRKLVVKAEEIIVEGTPLAGCCQADNSVMCVDEGFYRQAPASLRKTVWREL
jgi:hypothetical protein